MKTSQKGSASIALLILLIIVIITGLIFFYQNELKQNGFEFIPEKASPLNIANKPTEDSKNDTLLYTSNLDIQMAMQSFLAFADDNKSIQPEALCKGGFIDTDTLELKTISNRIVRNRIINANPIEYAKTQDEAGITCLATANNWVLFSALNIHSSNKGKNFYCIYSSGEVGYESFDREIAQCLK